MALGTECMAASACEKGVGWGEALALWSSIAEGVIEEDTITCNSAISACAKGGVWGEALALLGSMARDRIDIHTITCNAAIMQCFNQRVREG